MREIRKAERHYHTWLHDSTRWQTFAPRTGDIVIATQSKCGTTWMQRIVSLLVFQSPAPCLLTKLSPWIDQRFGPPLPTLWELIEPQEHRRFLKCHLPFDGLPIYDELRYIHVARDPRDACMSFFNHWSMSRPLLFNLMDAMRPAELGPVPRTPSSLHEFWSSWFSRGVLPGAQDGYPDVSFVELETSYWQARHFENLLLVHYNDLKADLEGELRRIAAFLGIETPAALWPQLVEAASFAAMKRDAPELLGPAEIIFEGGTDRFFFKGSNERWKEEISADDRLLADKLLARFSPGLRRWVEHGRLLAGDPLTAPD
ncbi:MAG TPA: sulfotransferase domain-containing protein [Polyangiales bacterium]|nr:sulfotransferase domain-containing protein [Polyangiales bacterium]